MTVATVLVAVCPIAFGWSLQAAGVVDSVIGSGLVSLGLAFGASWALRRWWSSREGSRDLLFSELLVWGWLRRLWLERRLSRALRLLSDHDAGSRIGAARRGALLAQMATSLEARDPYTHGHSRRVARHAATIARRMGLSRLEVENVRAAALLHDIGKMATPDLVLRKPDRLTDGEFDVIKQHVVSGAEMVSELGDERLTALVRHHHERLDGTGYPDGLSGDAIPLGARIIAVADTFDAITSARPYCAPRTHRTAIAILSEQAGTRFDPDAVRAFHSHYSGRRPLAAWLALAAAPERVLSFLGGGGNVATGSAVRLIATSALTGAAAVTAAVNIHPMPGRPTPNHDAAIARPGGNAGGTANGWQQAAAMSAGSVEAAQIAALQQLKSAAGAIVASPVLSSGSMVSRSTSVVDAIEAPAAGAASRGSDQLPSGTLGRGGGDEGQGGGGVGASARILAGGRGGGGQGGGEAGGGQGAGGGQIATNGGGTRGQDGSAAAQGGDPTQSGGGQAATGGATSTIDAPPAPAPSDGGSTTSGGGQSGGPSGGGAGAPGGGAPGGSTTSGGGAPGGGAPGSGTAGSGTAGSGTAGSGTPTPSVNTQAPPGNTQTPPIGAQTTTQGSSGGTPADGAGGTGQGATGTGTTTAAGSTISSVG